MMKAQLVTKLDRWVCVAQPPSRQQDASSPVGTTPDCSIKGDLDLFCNDRINHWTELSNDTRSSDQRLEAARQLVMSLGLETMQP